MQLVVFESLYQEHGDQHNCTWKNFISWYYYFTFTLWPWLSPPDIAAYLSLLGSMPKIMAEVEQLAQHTTAFVQPTTTTPQQHAAASPSAGPQLYTMETVRNMTDRMTGQQSHV